MIGGGTLFGRGAAAVASRRRSNRVLFRVDGGRVEGVSLGHVFRCLALAGDLAAEGMEIQFLMKADAGARALVEERGFACRVLGPRAARRTARRAIGEDEAAVVVFDLVDLDEDDLSHPGLADRTCVVLDDTGGRLLPADLIVNGHPAPLMRIYPPTADGPTYLLGPRYAILGPDFDPGGTRDLDPGQRRILVTLGGSDPTGLTLRILDALAPLFGVRVDVVLGPSFGADDEIHRAAGRCRADLAVHSSVADLAALMRRADVAIAAGGRTACELAATGTPAIIIPSNEQEDFAAEALERAGAALRIKAADLGTLGPVLGGLLADAARLAALSERGRHLVDGGGRRRVVGAMLALMDSHSRTEGER